MRKSAKLKLSVCLLLLCNLPQWVYADNYDVTVRHAELILKKNNYVLNADIDYQLGPTAIKALQSGIPLCWEVRVKVTKTRSWLWSETIADVAIAYRIRYQALLNLYLISNRQNLESGRYSRLSDALNALGSIRNFVILQAQQLSASADYIVAVKVFFNIEALPLPLRPEAYFDSEWALSSAWLQWPLAVAGNPK